jgi:hypothetical protein
MNLNQFEDAVRAASQPSDEPASLSSAIDRRIRATKTRRTTVRRFRWAFAVCAAITLALLAWPAVSAQAQLRRIAGALDDVSTLLMEQYSVDSSGKKTPAGLTAYQNGRWRMENPSNTTYYLDGKCIWLDSFTKSYVSESEGEFFSKGKATVKLSGLLGPDLGVGRGVDVDRNTVLNGRPALRVRFVNNPFNERHTIYADPESELPIRQEVEVKERGTWRLKLVMEFSYPATLPAGLLEPDLRTTPLISQEEWQSRVVSLLAKNELGAAPTKQGRVVVRAVDVAEDGTVYVAYQSGDKSRTWRGHGLELEDNLGTKYVHAIEVFSAVDDAFIGHSKDGKLEVEVFVPLDPVTTWRERRLSVKAAVGWRGTLSRFIRMGVNHPDGSVDIHWGKNNYSASDPMTGDKIYRLCAPTIKRPTCVAMPTYMQLVDPTAYGNDLRARISRARARSRHYMDTHDDRAAEFWLREQLRLTDEHEARGYGGYGRSEALENLDKIKEKSGR